MAGGERSDPRPARSRARLLDAATALLRSGGPSAVTIDAVTRSANVARATLYGHFSSANDLLAASFMTLIPPPPMPPEHGSLDERLTAIVVAWAESIAEAPITLTAMAWLSLGPDIASCPTHTTEGRAARRCDPCANASRAVLGAVRRDLRRTAGGRGARNHRPHVALALLIGPLAFGRLSTLGRFRLPEGGGRRRRRIPQELREGSGPSPQ